MLAAGSFVRLVSSSGLEDIAPADVDEHPTSIAIRDASEQDNYYIEPVEDNDSARVEQLLRIGEEVASESGHIVETEVAETTNGRVVWLRVVAGQWLTRAVRRRLSEA